VESRRVEEQRHLDVDLRYTQQLGNSERLQFENSAQSNRLQDPSSHANLATNFPEQIQQFLQSSYINARQMPLQVADSCQYRKRQIQQELQQTLQRSQARTLLSLPNQPLLELPQLFWRDTPQQPQPAQTNREEIPQLFWQLQHLHNCVQELQQRNSSAGAQHDMNMRYSGNDYVMRRSHNRFNPYNASR